MTARDVIVLVFPYVFYLLVLLAIASFSYVVMLSFRHRRRSSMRQVVRLVLTMAALVVVGLLSERIGLDWAAAGFGLISGLGVSWWYGKYTVQEASLGVNVALIVLVASLMTVSIVLPDWLDPRSFLISGSLVGIRLLLAASPAARVLVPSRRHGDRAMRIATISMLLFAGAAAFLLAGAVAGAEALNDAGLG